MKCGGDTYNMILKKHLGSGLRHYEKNIKTTSKCKTLKK